MSTWKTSFFFLIWVCSWACSEEEIKRLYSLRTDSEGELPSNENWEARQIFLVHLISFLESFRRD
jgi:hypothetical protein